MSEDDFCQTNFLLEIIIKIWQFGFFFFFTIWRIWFIFFYEKSFVEVEIIYFRSKKLEILSIKEMLVEENSYAYSL